MSLATRCSGCTTVFRVVQDQLKVSEGWVRCGRCGEIFNALDGLLDMERDEPGSWNTQDGPRPRPPDPSPPEASAGAAGAEPDGAVSDLASVPPEVAASASDRIEADVGDRIDAHLFRNRRADKASASKSLERDRPDFSDARFDSDLFADNLTPAEVEQAELQATGVGDLPLENSRTPEFLRRAERRARWSRTPMRAALGIAALLSAALLPLQTLHHFRDSIAARWPSTRPALLVWCEVAGCTVEAPRRIDDVRVESTALTRAVGRDAYVLSVNLRSRAATVVALPSVDLSLTDGNGRLIARRALFPRDFQMDPVLPAGADAALQLTLATTGARVAGYTVELFYP